MGINFNPGGGGGGGGGQPTVGGAGTVSAGDAAIISSTLLSTGNTFEVTEATLILTDGQPAPTGLDMLIVSLDGSGGSNNESTLLSGDGATQFVDQTGNPLGSYNYTGGAFDVAGVYVDNGNFGAGTGADQDVLAEAIGGIA